MKARRTGRNTMKITTAIAVCAMLVAVTGCEDLIDNSDSHNETYVVSNGVMTVMNESDGSTQVIDLKTGEDVTTIMDGSDGSSQTVTIGKDEQTETE